MCFMIPPRNRHGWCTRTGMMLHLSRRKQGVLAAIEPTEEQLHGLLLLAGPPPSRGTDLDADWAFWKYAIHVTETVHEYKWPPAYKYYSDGTVAFRAGAGSDAIRAFIEWVRYLHTV